MCYVFFEMLVLRKNILTGWYFYLPKQLKYFVKSFTIHVLLLEIDAISSPSPPNPIELHEPKSTLNLRGNGHEGGENSCSPSPHACQNINIDEYSTNSMTATQSMKRLARL